MKRGGELKRKTPMRNSKKRRVHVSDAEVIEDFRRFHSGPAPTAEDARKAFALPKLPPIPESLAKAAKKVTRRPKTTKARQAARGMDCQIRVPGVCESNNETVVLCHYRLAGTSGMGEKPHDSQAAYGCRACHDAVDGRRTTIYSKTELRLMHAEGVFRTQAIIRAQSAL